MGQRSAVIVMIVPVAAQNSKSSISRENSLFFEKFFLISANVVRDREEVAVR